jgi:hypothetical protein
MGRYDIMSVKGEVEYRVVSVEIGVLKLRVCGLRHGKKSEDMMYTEVTSVVCVVR